MDQYFKSVQGNIVFSTGTHNDFFILKIQMLPYPPNLGLESHKQMFVYLFVVVIYLLS